MVDNSSEIDQRIRAATVLVGRAAQVAVSLQQKNLSIKQKDEGPGDIVTRVDKICERILIDGFRLTQGLRQRFPSDGFRSEELGKSIPTESGFVWINDPIDGTLCFANGDMDWGISAGLHHNDQPVGGVIEFPRFSEDGWLVTTRLGFGTEVNHQKVKTTARTDIGKMFVCFNYSYLKDPEQVETNIAPTMRALAGRVGYIKVPDCVTLTLTRMAMGMEHVFLHAGVSPYDLGAADLAVREAGGVTSKIDWSKPRQAYLATANEGLFDNVLKFLGNPLVERYALEKNK